MHDLKELIRDEGNEIKIEMVCGLLESNDIKYTYESQYTRPPKKVAIFVKEEDYERAKSLITENKVISNLKLSNEKPSLRILGIFILIFSLAFFIYSIVKYLFQ